MKKKQFLSLAWDNYKSTKYNLTTVLWLSVSMVFLIIAIWLAFSVGINYSQEIKTSDIVNSAIFNVKNQGQMKSSEYEKYLGEFDPVEIKELRKVGFSNAKLQIAGNEYAVGDSNKLQVVFAKDAKEGFLLKSYEKAHIARGERTLLAGRLPDKAGETVISQAFLRVSNMTIEELIGKTISMNYEKMSYGTIEVVTKFEDISIVGVVDQEYANIATDGDRNSVMCFMDISSLVISDDETSNLVNKHIQFTSEENKDIGTTYFWQMKSFDDMSEVVRQAKIDNQGHISAIEFTKSKTVADILVIALNVSLVVAALIYAIALYNFYLNSEFSYNEKRSFRNMMYAVGMNNDEIKKLSAYEMWIIVAIASAVSFIVSLAVSVIVTLFINKVALNSSLTILGDISNILSLWWYPIAAVIAVAISAGSIGAIFAILHRKKSKVV